MKKPTNLQIAKEIVALEGKLTKAKMIEAIRAYLDEVR